ncbi:3-oxoacyl-[acyl-carrier-protein] reductase [Acetivibrio cellulolyticus]|uniref:3-oxoacyl-[acyl-carrier-protein] reductase n=1 Tax=Acetivibrio cellulolyticus TaxID=35830 RepID=UPI0001E2D52B|nr:3-oxoacyl-[acyl-carrier-protein] reductase [Acetivibrio cellulolyticus]
MQLKGKTAIITGSSRGIGKAIARKLGQMGANIVLNGTTASDALNKTFEEFRAAGINVVVSIGDARDIEYVQAMVNTAVDTFGSVDILVNNAGITRDKLIIKMSESDWDDVLDINLKGAFLCTKAVSKIMMKQRSGKIINVTSVIGEIGNPSQTNYAASKAGLIGLTKATAKELAIRGINCNAVAPGLIATEMTEVLPENVKENYLNSIPQKRYGTPEDVANVVGFLVSEEANYITGQVINIDGGLVM